MSKSATRRRADRSREIQRRARELTLEHDYAGWTLDMLADAVGVSRRTLFNHVGSKEAAVLGERPELPDGELDTFRTGGPTGDLLSDVLHLVRLAFEAKSLSSSEVAQVRAIVEQEPSLIASIHSDTTALCERLIQDAAARPGETEDRARLAVTVAGAVALAAVDGTLCRSTDAALDDEIVRTVPLLRQLSAELRVVDRP